MGVTGATIAAGGSAWPRLARADRDAGTDSFVSQAQASLDKDALIKLALDLCNIESRLGQEENLARFYRDRMSDIGLTARLQPFAPNRANAVGTYSGSGGRPTLMFNGHLETHVPTGLNALPSAKIVDGDRLTAVGIWNMKASLAAYLAAVSAVTRAGIPIGGDIVVAGTAGAWDESPVETRLKGNPIEGYGIGTKHMISHGGLADFCIVGEPTSFKLVTQHFGINLARIDIAVKPTGTERKVWEDLTGSLPRPSFNAIDGAGEIVRALHAWIPDYQRKNELMGVPPPVSVSAIEGGVPWAPHIPASATIFIAVGSSPSAPANVVVSEIRPILTRIQQEYPSLDTRVEVHTLNRAPFVADETPGVIALEAAHAAVFRRRPERAAVQWYSDASALCQAGIPAVNYGPSGQWTPANETVRLDDLVNCARVYIDVIVRICAEKS